LKLKELEISHNDIQKLPDEIAYLQRLSKLLVTNNNLKTLPETSRNDMDTFS
jgi:Leucine-rich repeat (LRR) protein